MTVADIILEQQTGQDDFATVVAIHVASGTSVEVDDLVFDIENSKATEELRAPRAGILEHGLTVGQTVNFGTPIARIVPVSDYRSPVSAHPYSTHPEGSESHSDEPVSLPPPAPEPSAAVAEMPPPSSLAARPLSPPAMPKAPNSSAGAGRPVGNRKRVEIETLSQGAGATMLSVIGAYLGPLRVQRASFSVLRDRITDLVIFEAARLMRKFPRLNSYYDDGQIFAHNVVHAGLAIDGGERLLVYGIENADTVDLADLPGIITEAVVRYVKNELTASELSRATFTVSDLSADDLDFALPLLPKRQCLIIGVTHDARSGYRLFAGFDHRVSEGREVAKFLTELRDRLRSFGLAHSEEIDLPCCFYCNRTSADAAIKSRDKGLLRIVDRGGQEVFCCASCWNGW